MKKTIAIIILCLCMAMTLGACKKEGDMIETMLSTVFSSDNTNDTQNHTNNGTVADSDGHIGNENRETTNSTSDMNGTEDTVSSSENSVM